MPVRCDDVASRRRGPLGRDCPLRAVDMSQEATRTCSYYGTTMNNTRLDSLQSCSDVRRVRGGDDPLGRGPTTGATADGRWRPLDSVHTRSHGLPPRVGVHFECTEHLPCGWSGSGGVGGQRARARTTGDRAASDERPTPRPCTHAAHAAAPSRVRCRDE